MTFPLNIHYPLMGEGDLILFDQIPVSTQETISNDIALPEKLI